MILSLSFEVVFVSALTHRHLNLWDDKAQEIVVKQENEQQETRQEFRFVSTNSQSHKVKKIALFFSLLTLSLMPVSLKGFWCKKHIAVSKHVRLPCRLLAHQHMI